MSNHLWQLNPFNHNHYGSVFDLRMWCSLHTARHQRDSYLALSPPCWIVELRLSIYSLQNSVFFLSPGYPLQVTTKGEMYQLVRTSLSSGNDSVQQCEMLKMISYTRWTNPGKPEQMMKWAELFCSMAAGTGLIIAARRRIIQAGTDLTWLITDEYTARCTRYLHCVNVMLIYQIMMIICLSDCGKIMKLFPSGK